MSNVTAEIKAKISKLLRMQTSSNENEAANAALLVQKLCEQHGISSTEISADYDPEKDEATRWDAIVYGRRRNAAEVTLLGAVVMYFNGRLINNCKNSQTVMEVFATKGRKIQIELYFEYLREVCEEQAAKSKLVNDPYKLDRSYTQNFKKAFANVIWQRLLEMKLEQEKEQPKNVNNSAASVPGLVLQRRNREQQTVNALVSRTHPRLTKGSGFTGAGGRGADSGKSAGQSVGLSRQVNTGRRLALAAG